MKDIIERNYDKILSIGKKVYYRMKLSSIIELEDFIQNVLLQFIKEYKNFDCSYEIEKFIYTISFSRAKREIENAHGKSNNYDKLNIKINSLSLDYQYKNDENCNNLGDRISLENNFENESIYRLQVKEIFQNEKVREKDKKVMLLYMGGLKYREISTITGIPISTIQGIFKRLGKILRN